MDIFLKNKNKIEEVKDKVEFEEVKDKVEFGDEEDLETFLIENPVIFPIKNFSDDATRFIPISNQLETGHGPLDIIGVDNVGTIYIIECKLKKNPDKRKIRGQITDYWSKYVATRKWYFPYFLEDIKKNNFESEAAKKHPEFFQKDLENILQDNLDEQDDITEVTDSIKQNFEKANYRLILALDALTVNIRDAIEAHNFKTETPMYAIEIQRFLKPNSPEYVAINTYPDNIHTISRSSGVRVHDNDYEKFLSALQKSNLTPIQKDHIKQFVSDTIKLVEKEKGENDWGSSPTVPRFLPSFPLTGFKSPLYLNPKTGHLRLQFQMLFDTPSIVREKFRKSLEQIPEIKSTIESAKKRNKGKEQESYAIPAEKWLSQKDAIIKILAETFSGET